MYGVKYSSLIEGDGRVIRGLVLVIVQQVISTECVELG